MSEKMVILKTVNASGHSEDTMTATEAFTAITEAVNNDSKWLFLDGTMTQLSNLTIDMIENAEELFLANQIVGG